jgi:hypothetical protein
VNVADAPDSFEEGKIYTIVCQNDEFTVLDASDTFPASVKDRYTVQSLDAVALASANTLPEGLLQKPSEGKALLVVDNQCTSDLSVAYKIDPLIPWPIFKFFEEETK